MKKILHSWIILGFLFSACAGSKPSASISEAEVARLVAAKDFAFRANQMLPTGARSRVLTENYLFTVSPQQIVSDLPYAGRAYTVNPGSGDGGMRFTSKDFTYQQASGKNNGWVITINPKDQSDVRECILNLYANGNADLSITSNNRQMIRYSGYILPNTHK